MKCVSTACFSRCSVWAAGRVRRKGLAVLLEDMQVRAVPSGAQVFCGFRAAEKVIFGCV